jgi:uncharacterized protein
MMSNTDPQNAPVAPSERILSLDVLRGFAVLGILIMNIQSFAMVEAAYFNPTAYGDLTGLNKWVWILSHVFADLKFLSTFSILFGAGIVLMSTKAEARGRRAAGVHYRRTLYLIVIGLIHAYLLWCGDILVAYGLCALVVFLFRKVSPKWLLTIGLIATSVPFLLFLFFQWSLSSWTPEAYQNISLIWSPSRQMISQEIAAYQGGWLQQMNHRVPASLAVQTFAFLTSLGWRAGGMMLIGMALFKWRVLTAERSNSFYLKLMAVASGVGFPIVAYGVISNFAADWSLEYSMFLGSRFNYWGSLFIALAYVSAVMLACRLKRPEKLIHRLAAVGRMALTNYLMQTIICTAIFYGHGLGLFGQLERYEQILVVLAVWLFLLIVSPIWLRFFRFGPAEWLWRSLTYRRFQPMRCKSLKPPPKADIQKEVKRRAD